MNPIARNILAAIVGFVIGSVVNLGLVTIGMSVWFIATDLLLAYIPMAFLGGFLAGGKRSQTA
ncbi:MAG: hypothetical protein H7Z17_13845 [Fuerstia sp.]|nr:hypothetical protein [Fuerstiella sp.]